ncbi:THO complex subunit 7A-like [Dorcoceras hygrometricum]|uniref:THO complex subunit 7A-like n=1 Tax=Dorcoceras hygrometricum TaxID=472368 RepID=A0A2Z7B1I4_9LAMI|nr:THO complex subunit 7A-like [Dorcoceras hygrometricum]
MDLIDGSTAAYREVPFSLRNRSEPGTSCQQADEAKVDSVATQRYPDAIDEPVASNSSIQSRVYLYQLLLYIQSQDTVSSRKKSRRKELKKKQTVATLPVATQRFQSQEDSGEAFDDPVASNSSIQSRDYLNQLLIYIQSQALRIQSQALRIQSQAEASRRNRKLCVSSRKLYASSRKLKHPDASYPVAVFEASAVAQSEHDNVDDITPTGGEDV